MNAGVSLGGMVGISWASTTTYLCPCRIPRCCLVDAHRLHSSLLGPHLHTLPGRQLRMGARHAPHCSPDLHTTTTHAHAHALPPGGPTGEGGSPGHSAVSRACGAHAIFFAGASHLLRRGPLTWVLDGGTTVRCHSAPHALGHYTATCLECCNSHILYI